MKFAERITASVQAIMDAKSKLGDPGLSDRARGSLEGEVESLVKRIDQDVFRLYGVDAMP